jgi:hypothetical protein
MKSRGALYFEFFYPGFFGVEVPSGFVFTIAGRPVAVAIQRRLTPAELTDFSNFLKPDPDNSALVVLEHAIDSPSPTSMSFKLAMVKSIDPSDIPPIQDIPHAVTIDKYESDHTTYRTRYFTDVVVAYEVQDPQKLSQSDLEFRTPVLNEFLWAYRAATKDLRVRLIEDLQEPLLFRRTAIRYTKAELALPPEQRLAANRELQLKEFQLTFPYSQEPYVRMPLADATRALNEHLATGKRISQAHEFLARATEAALYTKNFKFAVIEALIAAETSTTSVVTKLKLARGASKGKLDDYEEEVTLAYKLNIELPVLLGDVTSDERDTVGQVDAVRKMRNDIVHKGFVPTEKEARRSTDSVEKYLIMLSRRGLYEL